MRLLERERATLERFLPGLDARLAAAPWSELERPGGGALGWFREAGGPGLLIPQSLGGLGASALEGVAVQRALGSRSPSLAVATTMHHFSVATVVEMARAGTGLEGILLRAVAAQRRLVASGFAEGRSGQSVLAPLLRGVTAEGGIRVSGSKRPCSLTWSMDLLSASVALEGAEPGDEIVVVLIPAEAEGIARRPFWRGPVLAGAESDEVELTDVFVPTRLVFPIGGPGHLHPTQDLGFLWFELLIAASYLGIASALVERLLLRRAPTLETARLAAELEGAAAALEGAAHAFELGQLDLGRALAVRYAVQEILGTVGPRAFAALGGMAFLESEEPAHLLAASQALAFHPPTSSAGLEALAEHLAGAPLRLR